MICPYCGSEDVVYEGHDDGGGDYGDAIVEIWSCGDCGSEFEANEWREVEGEVAHFTPMGHIRMWARKLRWRVWGRWVYRWRNPNTSQDLPF